MISFGESLCKGHTAFFAAFLSAFFEPSVACGAGAGAELFFLSCNAVAIDNGINADGGTNGDY